MRVTWLLAAALAATCVTPAVASDPDLSMATLTRLDDRLWAAGDDWQAIFSELPLAQQRALVALNEVTRIETTEYLRPRECEVQCEEVEKRAEAAHPAAGRRPTERQPAYVVAPPLFECDSRHGEIGGYTITGKLVLLHTDTMTWCVDALGAFYTYAHGQNAATYGWGWQVGSCICQEASNPPVADSRQHTFYSQQTYYRQFALGPIGFTDHHETAMKGSVTAVGPYRASGSITGL